MQQSHSKSYSAAGVDITAGYRSVEMIQSCVKKTEIPGVLGSIGGFGGMFEIENAKYTSPVFVSGTDGVGTKLKIAFLTGRHATVGIDCVAMCVNDIVCTGAKPLFFLDYIACGKNIPEKIAQIVRGVADGCVQAGCALVGGETAEHPGLMPPGEYDLAGFSVGVVEKSEIITKGRISPGDAVIGIASSGVHSNGFSLVRKVFDVNEKAVNAYVPELGATLGEALLTPTKIYVKPLLGLTEKLPVNGISHITGGGFYENVPRMLPAGLTAVIEKAKCFKQPIFDLIAKTGNIPERDMYNTFNMGVGMVLAVAPHRADEAVRTLRTFGESAAIIGEIKASDSGVQLV